VRGRFLVNLVAAALAIGVLTFTFWQAYVGGALSSEITYWQDQIAGHKRQFAELKAATKQLETKVARLDEAYNLMREPYSLSDLIISFGRTRVPHMTIASINGFAGGVVLRGTLHEPSGTAAQTISRYVADLRKDPAIGPLFTTIALVSLDRAEGTDVHTFEVACKLKAAPSS
jgi:cell division protein FtsB